MGSPPKIDVEALLAPIPGDKPTGVSLAYEAVYDQIKQARKASDTMDQGDWQTDQKVSDWKAVEQLAGKALKERSKDLQLAVWLTEAAVHRYAYAGLRDGLRLLKGLVEKFWDGLYPEPDEGDLEPRAAPLSWLGVKFSPELKAIPLTKSGREVEFSWNHWDEGRATDNAARKSEEARAARAAEGKISGEDFQKALAATPRAFVEEYAADLQEATEAFAELDKLCDEKFGRDAPSTADLKKVLETLGLLMGTLLKTKREQEPDADAPTEAPAEAPAEEAPADAGAPTAEGAAPARPARKKGSPAAECESREDAVARIASAAEWLRKNEPAGPPAYLTLRALRWGEMRSGGATPDASLAEAPASEVRQKLRAALAESNWEVLLTEAESAAAGPAGRAWIDLHRYTYMALSNLGHQAAAEALKSELRAYLADYPQLLEAELNDGTPATGNETRKWLTEAQVIAAKAEEPAPAAAEPEPAPEPPPAPTAGEPATPAEPDAWEVAQKLVKSRKPQQAFALIREKVNTAQTGRDRFYRKLQLAELCLMTDKRGLALPLLEELAAEVDRYHVEDWETKEWSARVWGALYRCYKGAGDGSAEKARQAYARLCRLDITQALAWGEE